MTEDLLGDLVTRVSPETVSPIVAYLAHEDCEVNGNVYSVAGGRVARIVVAETPGVVLREITAEAMRDQLAAIDEPGEQGYQLPSSLSDETTIIAKALADASAEGQPDVL
jgi:hypothetical protein